MFERSLIVIDYSFISRKTNSPLPHIATCHADAYPAKMKHSEEWNAEKDNFSKVLDTVFLKYVRFEY